MPIYRERSFGRAPGQDKHLRFLEKFLARSHQRHKPPTPKEKPKDTSIFGGKPYLSTREATWKIRKGPGDIPQSGKRYTERERESLAKKSFEKVGPFLEKRELPEIIKQKEKILYNPYTRWKGSQKEDLKREIRFLKKRLFGK